MLLALLRPREPHPRKKGSHATPPPLSTVILALKPPPLALELAAQVRLCQLGTFVLVSK